MVPPAELSDLSAKLGFALADLKLNRVGQLSAAQSWSALRDGATALGLVFLALGGLFLMIGMRTTTTLRIVWSVLVIPGLAVVFYFFGLQLLGALQRRVMTAEGSPDFRGGHRGPPSLIIGRATVPAPTNATEVLSKNRRYRLYYLARIDTFLSIEPL